MARKPNIVDLRRRQSTQSAIRRKVAEGRATGKERALVRIGPQATRILTGQEDLSVWTNEELLRGKRKDKDGGWRGKPPVVVPKAVHDELVRRTLAKANELMRDNLVMAVEVLTEIVTGQDVEPKDKLTAIKMIMDRVMGKEPVTVDVKLGSKLDEVLNDVVLDRDSIDADAWEEGDEENDASDD